MDLALAFGGNYRRQEYINTIPVQFEHGRPATQFMYPDFAKKLGMPLKAGDIVKCNTNPRHDWGISEYVEPCDDGAILRELAGTRLLRMQNESFDVLRFHDPTLFYWGHKRVVYDWARGKAFNRASDDLDCFRTRCGGVEIDGDTLKIWVRAHIFSMERVPKEEPKVTTYAQPFCVEMPWGPKTRMKDIVQALKDGGIANEFEYLPEKPTRGNAGFVTFTRESLLEALK